MSRLVHFFFRATPNKLIAGPEKKKKKKKCVCSGLGGGSSGQPAMPGKIGRSAPPGGAAPRQGPASGRRGYPARPGRPLHRAAPRRAPTTALGRALPDSGSARPAPGLAVAPH